MGKEKEDTQNKETEWTENVNDFLDLNFSLRVEEQELDCDLSLSLAQPMQDAKLQNHIIVENEPTNPRLKAKNVGEKKQQKQKVVWEAQIASAASRARLLAHQCHLELGWLY